MKYSIKISKNAITDLKKIPKIYQKKIDQKILTLADEPRPEGVKKLKGTNDLYRIRISDYRIIYKIRDNELLILIVKIGHRKNVYGK